MMIFLFDKSVERKKKEAIKSLEDLLRRIAFENDQRKSTDRLFIDQLNDKIKINSRNRPGDSRR